MTEQTRTPSNVTHLPTALAKAMQGLQRAANANDRDWARQQEMQAWLAARDARRQHIESLQNMRVTADVRAALIAGKGLTQTKALTAAQAWLGSQSAAKPCLVLAGATGRGKSVAAAWVAAELGGVWLTCQRAARLFGAAFGPQYEQQNAALDAHTLVVDDVGSEVDDLAPRMCAALIELLEQRKEARYRTVITTNLAGADFKARYPDVRLMSRLSGVQWVTASGSDLRLVGPAE